LYTFRYGRGLSQVDLDLDSRIVKQGASYRYGIGFSLRGNAESKPPSQAGLKAFRSVTDLQVSPHSLPALSLGKNVIRFRDQSPGPRRVRITHRWREISDRHSPAKVETALSPQNGKETESLSPALKWSTSTDPDASDKVVDYQVMVSLRPDCRWLLSPTLYQSMGSDQTEWRLPAGFLNPGTTYYWKVRARDNRGDIGEWSRIFRFTTSGGAN
jgi:hypothetical protein